MLLLLWWSHSRRESFWNFLQTCGLCWVSSRNHVKWCWLLLPLSILFLFHLFPNQISSDNVTVRLCRRRRRLALKHFFQLRRQQKTCSKSNLFKGKKERTKTKIQSCNNPWDRGYKNFLQLVHKLHIRMPIHIPIVWGTNYIFECPYIYL